VWDDTEHAPPPKTEADWIKAGEIVFDAATDYDRVVTVPQSRDPAWYEQLGTPVARDGTVPFFRYVIRKKGTVEVGQISCAWCHTRVLPDGSTLKGAQANFATVRAVAFGIRSRAAKSKDTSQLLARLRLGYRAEWSVPWLSPDPAAPVEQMSLEELVGVLDVLPAGVVARQRTSVFYPAQVPDLVGVKERKYLDHTGLQQQRSIEDLMRYAAMNRGRFDGGDALANHNGFIPADEPRFQKNYPTRRLKPVTATTSFTRWASTSILFNPRQILTSLMHLLSEDRRSSSGRAAVCAIRRRSIPITN
jgi:hypothetical protein